jgi:hypothetical protein
MGGFDCLRLTTVHFKTKSPDAGSGLDEVKYGYLLLVYNRYAHINLPTMRGLNMMMVVLERGLVIHIGQYSMPGRGMSQGDIHFPSFAYNSGCIFKLRRLSECITFSSVILVSALVL